MLHELNLSITELIAVMAFAGSIVTVWINTKVKIAKIETTVTLKMASLETKIAEYIQTNSKTIEEFVKDNKAEHREIAHDVRNIRQSINGIDLKIAKL